MRLCITIGLIWLVGENVLFGWIPRFGGYIQRCSVWTGTTPGQAKEFWVT